MRLEEKIAELERKLTEIRLLAGRELARETYSLERAKKMWGHALWIVGTGEGGTAALRYEAMSGR